MKNITYQSSLFQIRRGTNHTEYRDLCERLDFVDRIFSTSGVEFEFAEYYLERIVQTSGNPELKLLVPDDFIRKIFAIYLKISTLERIIATGKDLTSAGSLFCGLGIHGRLVG